MNQNKHIVEVQELYKIFGEETEVRALNGVSFKVAHGDFLGMTGPSDSGKSTLLSILGSLDHLTGGSVSG